jgi:hypothetical protein
LRIHQERATIRLHDTEGEKHGMNDVVEREPRIDAPVAVAGR